MQIYSLEFSQSDAITVSASLLKTVKPHSTPVVTIAVDATGTLVATGSADGVIKIWDIRGGYVTHTFRGHSGVISALYFFQTSETEPDQDLSTIIGKKKKHHKNKDGEDKIMTDVGLSSNNKKVSYRIASGNEDGQIRVWDLEKRKSLASLDSHVSVVRDLQFSSKANVLLSASRDKTAIIWDMKNFKVKKVIPLLEGVEAIGVVGDGAFFYTGGENGRLRIWELKSGREVTREQEPGGETDGIVHVLHNFELNFILSVHADQSLNLHSIAPLLASDIASLPIEPLPILRRISGTHDEVIDLAYVTPNRGLLAIATNSESLRLVSLSTASTSDSQPFAPGGSYFGADVALLQGHEDIIICLDVDWSGCWLATGAKDNTARLWRIDQANQSFRHFATFTGHAESIGAIALPSNPPPHGSPAFINPLEHPPPFLLTGSQDRTIKKWEIARINKSKKDSQGAPRALYTRKAHDKDINAITTNHNSTLFASASQDRTVKVWSTDGGEVQGILRGHRRGVWAVSFAPKEAPPILGESGVASTSRRGLILTGGGDKSVKIWSLEDYSCLRTLEGHTNSILKVLWMPIRPFDATSTNERSQPPLQVATAGGDGLVKIWDSNTGEVVATLDNHSDRIWALTVHPETNALVSGGGDSTITFWKDTTAKTIATNTALATARVEQEQQLQNYVHAGHYREAITLALQLNQPGRLLSLLQSVVSANPPEAGSLSGNLAVDSVLSTLSDSQLLLLISRVRDWNTNARTAVVAQRVLGVILRSYSAERLAGLRGRGWKEMLDALAAYTERHYKRVEGLLEESYMVDFTLIEMEETGFLPAQD